MIAGRKPHQFLLPKGLVLRVEAGDDSRGKLRLLSGRPVYTPYGDFEIEPGVTYFGPYETPMRGFLVADAGHLEFKFASDLEAKLYRGTSVIKSARIIAEALKERTQLIEEKKAMAMQDKFKMLAERAQSVPRLMSQRADHALARLDAAEQRGIDATGRIDAVITDVEKGVAAVEDAANQLSNGAPLEPSAT